MLSLRFQPQHGNLALTLIVLPPLILLGLWQLERADEKRVLLDHFAARAERAPVALDMLNLNRPQDDLRGLRVHFQGRYDVERQWYLDNKVRGGRFGYEVVTPVQWGGLTVLVNRGWLPGDPARRALPEAKAPQGVQQFEGKVHVPLGQLLELGKSPPSAHWPKLVSRIDLMAMSEALGQPVYPYSIRLSPNQPGALEASWVEVAASPLRHIAYAVQWFGLATALLVLFCIRSFKHG